MSEDELKSFMDMIDDYLARGQIRYSTGSCGLPFIIIRKKTGELRIVIDNQLLNKQTRLDSYPIPCIDELLDHLAHSKYFSKIDLASGYQIQMTDGHEENTALVTRYDTYEWMVFSLGLTNAPGTFQRLMNGILHHLLDKTLLVYLDDLLVHSDTDLQHLEDVKQVLQNLRNNKLKSKTKKCNFNAQQVEYFGHIFLNGTVAMDPFKVSAVMEWPFFMNVEQLKSFLDFCNYYNRFLKNYSRNIAPLIKILQKDAVCAWGDQQASFEELVHSLTSTPVLQML